MVGRPTKTQVQGIFQDLEHEGNKPPLGDPALFSPLLPSPPFTTHPLEVGIVADSKGAIAPTAKKLWGRCPQVAPTGILKKVH